MTLRVIANKRIDITDDEFQLYQKICNSYPQGKELFRDLFETDQDGMIVFLAPPEKEFSMEVVIFLQNILVHQHMRKVYKEYEKALEDLHQYKEAVEILKETVSKLSLDIEELQATTRLLK